MGIVGREGEDVHFVKRQFGAKQFGSRVGHGQVVVNVRVVCYNVAYKGVMGTCHSQGHRPPCIACR